MSELSLLHPPAVEATAAPESATVLRFPGMVEPISQPQLNDRELMFLRTLIANHAHLLETLLQTREQMQTIATGCPVARRLLVG